MKTLSRSVALVARDPILNLGANGKSCTIVRYDDAKGAELMHREKCSGGTDTLSEGALLYVDVDGNGKIEAAERLATPIALTDFAPNVTIMGNGKIASRERQDKDHDGNFDVESVTASTSFVITTIVAAAAPAH